MQMISNVHHASYPLCLLVFQSVCAPVSFSQSEVCDKYMYEHFALTREQCRLIYPFDELEQCDPKMRATNTTIGTGSL